MPWLDEQSRIPRSPRGVIALVISAFAHGSRWEGSTRNATASDDDDDDD
jgi:hypothetical protein